MHTPGLWHWGKDWGVVRWDSETDTFSEKYASLGLVGPDGQEIIPLRIDHYDTEWDVSEDLDAPNQDDRRLIAAAPELLENLRDLVADIEYHGHGIEMDKHLNLCRATIAKATQTPA